MDVKCDLKGVLFKLAGRRTLSVKFEFIISMLALNKFFTATLRLCQGFHCCKSGRKLQFQYFNIDVFYPSMLSEVQ